MNRIRVIALILAAAGNQTFAQSVSVDQAGYLPALPKYVFVAAAADTFRVIDAASLTERYKGALTLWKSGDPSTGKTVRRGDFSLFQESGRYRVVAAAGDTSEPFGIGDTIDAGVYRKSLKGFYYQRCGTAILAPYAGPYVHAACHVADGLYHATAESTGYRNVIGGWHDAGDYGKYVVNAGVSVGTMLMAYEYFPAKFSQDDLGIPESGNGVPDLLDEVRYELSWLLKMQRADGGVYCKVTRTTFEGFIMPQNDAGTGATRYLYEVTSAATADFAAMMARASRVYRRFDTTYANTCLSAAVLAWSFVSAHPFIVPAGGFKNPSGTSTGEYGDGSDDDERLWAAAELYDATGDSEYRITYEVNAGGVYFGSPVAWPNVRSMADITYLMSTQPSASATIRDQMKSSLNVYCASAVTRRNSSGYQVVLQSYNWGSNSDALNAAVLLIIGYETLGTAVYRDAAADQLHYVLGANGLRRSYLTGVGTRSTLHPHHRPSESDGIAAPVPGLLSGGPNQYLSDPALLARFTASTPPALCYLDTMPSYASNEIAINWNAPLVFVSGYFTVPRATSISPEEGSFRPGGIRLDQNYPNPFNPLTVIAFALPPTGRTGGPVTTKTRLIVYDTLGREVATLVDEGKAPGNYSVVWDASHCASGAYFALLTSGENRAAIKLLVVK
jgi:endoglucanase